LNQDGRVAQLVEQCPFKAWVEGSSPSALTNPGSWLRHSANISRQIKYLNRMFPQAMCACGFPFAV
jgi:hypothetical protein